MAGAGAEEKNEAALIRIVRIRRGWTADIGIDEPMIDSMIISWLGPPFGGSI
jgi:hypothetical protein